MRTIVNKYCQTTIPAQIRRRYNIAKGDSLEWVDDGKVIRIIPIPADPVKALRGRGKGEGLVEKLIVSRTNER
jgi:bifunctional DNA-binding transcriptional regulator/antitoxin component of YhaV-PrlF toxin-antitoxin module